MVLSPSLMQLLYPPPPSLFVKAMSVIGVALSIAGGFKEAKGENVEYSKFSRVGGGNKSGKKAKMPSKNGMLLLYTPAFLSALASFALYPNEGLRFYVVTGALSIHFMKRVLEVVFVHNYSGSIDVQTTIFISLSYFSGTTILIYAQHLTQGFLDPSINLMYPGVVIFLIGIGGNLYHHYLLSNLRSKGEKEYKIPRGGLFSLVICPHYLFEILGFIGISCISQTIYAVCYTLGTFSYLTGRSYSTRNWYISKFENFPKDVKAIIPYVF